MIKIAIVEDDKSCQDQLLGFVARYNDERHAAVKADVFSRSIDFLSDYDGSYCAVFMDIDMPVMSGMEAAKKLRLMDKSVSIIFTTNLANYAINGYEVGALDFIVKPVQYFNFISKLELAVSLQAARNDYPIVLALKDRKEIIKASELYYIENDAHMVIYHTARGDFSVRRAMNDVEKEFTGNSFASCGKSYIVNLAHVDTIDGHTVTVHGVNIPVSRSREKEFMQALTNYIGDVT